MAKKSNKTSHVMDLLTNGASSEVNDSSNEAGPSPAPTANQEKKTEVQSHTVTPKKVTVVDKGSRDDRISQEILNNLTQELEKETGSSSQEAPSQIEPEAIAEVPPPSVETSTTSEPEPDPEPVPVPEPQPIPEPESLLKPEPSSQPLQDVPVDSLGPGPSAIQELENQKKVSNGATMKVFSHGIVPESLVNTDLEGGQYRFVNVMELLLLRQNIPQLLDQHGVCNCERCMADVCALTLTGLPSKYVVTSKDSISPIVSYYENKFKIPLLTEFMKSCSKVREKPRHKI